VKPLILSFKSYPFRLKKQDDKEFIFDIVRRKFVALTPEEWVRQHVIHYLIEQEEISRSLLSVEKTLSLYGMTKRADIVVYSNEGHPKMIIECKAPEVKITTSVFDQAARYNLTLRVKYLLVTNGNESFCCEVDWENQKTEFLSELPELN